MGSSLRSPPIETRSMKKIRRGLRWLAASGILVAAFVAIAFARTWNVAFVPEFLAAHRFRRLTTANLGYAVFIGYSSSEPYDAIKTDAMREFSAKGYTASEERGGVVFERARRIKAVLIKGMRYGDDGSLHDDPSATSVWTATPLNLWDGLQQRFNVNLN